MLNLTAEFRGLSALSRRLGLVSQRLKAGIRQELDIAGWQAVRVARALVPVKTGALRSTIRFFIYRTSRGSVGFQGRLVAGSESVGYARYVEENTKPHKIRIKDAEWLHWTDEGGGEHFAKEVSHPGTRAQPFLRPARRILEGVLRERLYELAKRVVRNFRR